MPCAGGGAEAAEAAADTRAMTDAEPGDDGGGEDGGDGGAGGGDGGAGTAVWHGGAAMARAGTAVPLLSPCRVGAAMARAAMARAAMLSRGHVGMWACGRVSRCRAVSRSP